VHLAYEKGMSILTASGSNQEVPEEEDIGHSFLTDALLEGLQTEHADRTPKDGQVTEREWFDYAIERVQLRQQETIFDVRQQPQVFYRREAEAHPFVIARV
jgi:uncharacterized caspase-like protein